MSTANPSDSAGKSVRSGEGQNLMVMGMPHFVKIASGENAGGISVMEVVVAPGQGVPPHVHTREDEFFLILQGELTCQMQDAAPATYKAGDLLFLPRNRSHGFTNASAREARMMVITAPGAGSERMFAELASACEKFKDPAQLMPELARIGGSHGVTFAHPPQ